MEHMVPEALTSPVVIIMGGIVLIPLVLLRSLKLLAPAALVADVAILYGLITIFAYDFGLLAENGGDQTARPFDVEHFPLFFGTAVYRCVLLAVFVPPLAILLRLVLLVSLTPTEPLKN